MPKFTPEEVRWRPIPGWELFYEASDTGLIKSLRTGRPRSAPLYKGYRKVRLMDAAHGRIRFCSVAALVLETFIGPRPPGNEAAHLNGNPLDDRLSNLAWVSRTENQAHRYFHGTDQFGERNPSAKLTRKKVEDICRRRKRGERIADIASRYGVCETTVYNVSNRRNWTHPEIAQMAARCEHLPPPPEAK